MTLNSEVICFSNERAVKVKKLIETYPDYKDILSEYEYIIDRQSNSIWLHDEVINEKDKMIKEEKMKTTIHRIGNLILGILLFITIIL